MNSTTKWANRFVLIGVIALTACKSETPDYTIEPEVPSTYSFQHVSFSGQTDRLNQTGEMIDYIKTAQAPQVVLDIDVLMAMFENTGGDANGNFSFSSEKQLKDKCFGPHVANIEAYMSRAVEASESILPASNGQAGRLTSENGNSTYLFDANGMQCSELIEKGLMGAVFYYQATAVYLSDEKMDVDNTSADDEATEMEHHWDEAYGYFGATVDFPNNTDDVKYWAKYSVRRDDLLNSNERIGGALRKGRAAISFKDYEMRDEAISEVRESWEALCVGSAIHYLNEALASFDDDAIRNHVLSEGYGFIQSIAFNPEPRISSAEVDELLSIIGDNFYEVSSEDIKTVRDRLATSFEMEDIKTQL